MSEFDFPSQPDFYDVERYSLNDIMQEALEMGKLTPNALRKYYGLEPVITPSTKPKVITMCGSRRFEQEHIIAMRRLLLEGNIVFGNLASLGFSNTGWEKISYLQFKRIDISDAIFVVNPGHYIGEFTMKEILYAAEKGKEILFLEGDKKVTTQLSNYKVRTEEEDNQ